VIIERVNDLIKQLTLTPDEFEKILNKFPTDKIDWKPESWAEVPSEEFSAIGQICHLRDIEIDGYHIRFQRVVNEQTPFLPSIDGYELERQRQYHLQNPNVALGEFRFARTKTIEMLRNFRESDFERIADYEGYGEVTLMSLVYFLLSHDLQHLSGMNWLLAKIDSAS
jgi:DinB superfamily